MNERELRILQRITDSLRAIQQDIHTIYEKTRSDSDEEHPPTQVDIQSEIRLPPAVNDYYESENTEGPKDRRRDRVRLWLEGIALGAAVLAAIFTLKTLNQVRRQADAAQAQLRNSVESFRVDERAQIEIEPFKPNPFTPASGIFGASFNYELYPRNVGKTVAYDIAVRAFQSAPMSDLAQGDRADNITRFQAQLRKGMGISEKDITDALFRRVPKVLGPGVVSTVPFRLNGQEPKVFPNGTIYYFLIGRIDYADAFSIPHWMTFCFFISNSRGDPQYCREGNDEDRNPEVEPPKKP